MKPIYIALGANLSNRKAAFIKALESLNEAAVTLKGVSGVWQSPSWPPGQGHPDYLNAVACIDYEGSPKSLLLLLQSIEADHGRVRSLRNAPRPIDLDILDFRGQILNTQILTLPHPRMLGRGFVLFPLAQIAPNWRDPVSGGGVMDYAARLPLSDVAPMHYHGRLY